MSVRSVPHAPASDTESEQEALRLAFAAPLDRARATGLPLDRISLRDHIREVEIGAFQLERGITQRVRFDIVAEVIPDTEAIVSDDVDGILSYDTLIEAIDTVLDAERMNLLETLAERLAARVLQHDRAARVFVRIEKLDRGPHLLGVEIVRSRSQSPAIDLSDDTPRPRVVLLPPGAQDDAALPALLDRLAADPVPTVLVASLDFVPPATDQPMAGRRIALLALEQAAWRLAARDRRCVVVDSRTELDWSMRHAGLTVWAPSRLVLDATEGPDGFDAPSLARWFAQTFGAVELVTPDAPTAAIERQAVTLDAI
ncbi:MAG: dihydroneopterin aldolase [Jannaschia helgolandensis]|jgi:dihydroneopterin aldolase|uniref:dihydroneopterin aldolase n=1 Tax=Jannaschia helgolandensis TaxID=188906 RepID=A0A1H7RTH9_9RHOB|nr:dihydroneopterin aldolase [Jannaschia helgolandensis]SEL63590.1 dihydroneopterin aldolase [Jannaschia helgolandensis]|tara:strand:+ start:99 stop:1040 length:942 start_codon:yes stop_codon:yes gene_type:complete